MPRTSHVLPPDRRRERQQLLEDPLARRLLRELIVGPSDQALHQMATSAARLIQLGFKLLELVEGSAEPPPSHDLSSPRSLQRKRRGDRLRKDDCETWTDLGDGAAVQAALILASPDAQEIRQWVRKLTPAGLRASATSDMVLLLGELTPEERSELVQTATQPPRELRRATFNRQTLRRHAKALRAIAQFLEE